MHVKQKQPRRRHGDEFKAQVLAACAEPGASVSEVSRSFGVNDNLVHQWRRGRGYKLPIAAAPVQPASAGASQFVALALPAPSAVAAPIPDAAAQEICMELKRGALEVRVTWPLGASSESAAWLREVLG